MLSRYAVWSPSKGQTEDDAITLSAHSPQLAAQGWACQHDLDEDKAPTFDPESYVVACPAVEVCVSRLSTKKVTRWHVFGELRREYYAQSCA